MSSTHPVLLSSVTLPGHSFPHLLSLGKALFNQICLTAKY